MIPASMHHLIRRALLLAAWAMAAACGLASPAAAQTPALLQGAKLTPETIVDQLAIPDPAASGQQRGFRPARTGEKPKRYGPGRANLLVTFVTGSGELTDGARQILDKLAKAMQDDALAGVSFRIQGHADARGNADANQELSLQRAKSVAEYLASRHGILAERLKPEGKGSSEPMNKQRVDAPENRRVTIVSQRG